MKQHTQNNTEAMPAKKYVPYGMNGMYFVYDNEAGQIPMNYGAKGASKSVIQRMCNDLNQREAMPEDKGNGHTPGEIEIFDYINSCEGRISTGADIDKCFEWLREEVTETFRAKEDTIKELLETLGLFQMLHLDNEANYPQGTIGHRLNEELQKVIAKHNQ